MTTQGIQSWFESHRSEFKGEIFYQEPLSKHTYFRVGGPADVLLIPKSEADLAWVSHAINETQSQAFILGAGSNLLVSDRGFRGVVIKMLKMNQEITHVDHQTLRVGSGVLASTLLRKAGELGWGGLGFLAGIPGSMGGVVAMNAGTHLGEIGSHVLGVDVFDFESGKQRTVKGTELGFNYRKNLFLKPLEVVTRVELKSYPAEPDAVRGELDQVLKRRKDTQPLNLPSCGSVFKNPEGLKAWQVIDQLGLRGHQIGHARFSDKHSNFIVNLGGATANDILSLIQLAKKQAKEVLGIQLEEEVRYLGLFLGFDPID